MAIVGSVFDDILGASELRELRREGGALRFDDVWIDAESGVARVADLSRASVDAIAVLIVRALGDDAPAASLPVLSRFSTEGARDVEELRDWARDALGAIAPHDEVAMMVAEVLSPAPISEPPMEHSGDLPLLAQPTPLGIATAALEFAEDEAPAHERDNATEIMRTRSLPAFPASFSGPPTLSVPPPSAARSVAPSVAHEEELEVPILSAIPEVSPEALPETQMPERVDPSDAPSIPEPVYERASSDAPPAQTDSRPVIRHQLNQPTVRVASAPAARRSGKRVADPRDSLLIPDDRPHWGAWVFVILLLGIGALFWLRYL